MHMGVHTFALGIIRAWSLVFKMTGGTRASVSLYVGPGPDLWFHKTVPCHPMTPSEAQPGPGDLVGAHVVMGVW